MPLDRYRLAGIRIFNKRDDEDARTLFMDHLILVNIPCYFVWTSTTKPRVSRIHSPHNYNIKMADRQARRKQIIDRKSCICGVPSWYGLKPQENQRAPQRSPQSTAGLPTPVDVSHKGKFHVALVKWRFVSKQLHHIVLLHADKIKTLFLI